LRAGEVPLSAYQLLAALRDEGRGVPVMSIYQTLDRLVAHVQTEGVTALSAFRICAKLQRCWRSACSAGERYRSLYPICTRHAPIALHRRFQ